MAIKVAQIRLERTEDEGAVEDIINEHINADAIVGITTYNGRHNKALVPILVVLYRA